MYPEYKSCLRKKKVDWVGIISFICFVVMFGALLLSAYKYSVYTFVMSLQ